MLIQSTGTAYRRVDPLGVVRGSDHHNALTAAQPVKAFKQGVHDLDAVVRVVMSELVTVSN